MIIGYHTNGCRHHDLAAAARTLSDLGYGGIEVNLLRRWESDLAGSRELNEGLEECRRLGLEIVVSAGDPYVLGIERFRPTLFDPDFPRRRHRLEFIAAAIALAGRWEAGVVTFNSGHLRLADPAQAEAWLVEGLAELCDRAEAAGVRLALEPEPGHFIQTTRDYHAVRQAVSRPALGMNLDVGHVVCLESRPLPDVIAAEAGSILNVHFEDIAGRRHLHLPPGEGDADLTGALRALRRAGFNGTVSLELPSHSHCFPETARAGMEMMKRLMQEAAAAPHGDGEGS